MKIDDIKQFLLKLKPTSLVFNLLVAITTIFPFIIWLYLPNREKTSLDFIAFPNQLGDFDYYYYYKSIFLIILVYIGAIIALSKTKILQTKYSIALLIFFIFILFSAFFSDYRAITLKGITNSYQGTFIWIAYGIIGMIAYFLKKIKLYKTLIFCLLITASILSFYGLLELLQITNTKGLLSIISHSGFALISNVELPFIDKGNINSLFYSSNYYSIYLSMMIMLNISLFLAVNNKNHRILLFISYCLIFSNLIGSNNTESLYIFIINIFVLIIIFKQKIIFYFKKIGLLTITSIIIFIVISNLTKTNNNIGNSTLKDIIPKKNILEIQSFTNPSIFIKVIENKNVSFSDNISFKNTLSFKKNGDTIIFNKAKLKPYQFIFKDQNLFFKYKKLQPIGISYENNLFFMIIPGQIKSPIINTKKNKFFNKINNFGSGAAMVWSLSLPLMAKSFFLGYGADTFPLIFPNGDFVSKYKINKIGHYITARSYYIQMAIEFGVLALILFLILTGIYLKESFQLLRNINFKSFSHFIALGCFLSVLTFLLNGFFYSGKLSTAIYFWILIGIGIAANNIIRNEAKSK